MIEKELISSLADNGAPFLATDFVRFQNNNNIKSTSFLDYLVSRSGVTKQLDASSNPVREHQNGVFITEPVITQSAFTTVGACYVYLNGKVLYFEGATGQYSENELIRISEGPETITKATYEDGISRDLFTTSTAVSTRVNEGAGGSVPMSAAEAAVEHVYIRPTLTGGAIQTVRKSLGFDQVDDHETRITTIEAVKTKILNIGGWDMQNNSEENIEHGLNIENIRDCQVFIKNDLGSNQKSLASFDASYVANGRFVLRPVFVDLYRKSGGDFDSGDYNDAVINRGYIVITYV